MKKLQLPFGVQDFLPDECYNKKIVEDKIAQVFYFGGYEKIETASLEYYELFDGIVDKNAVNRMFKMTDIDGSLLILRPDTTLQVCRMAAAKADVNTINKYFYIEDSFEFLPDSATARTREFAQVGLELLGNSGIDGTIEAIVLAVEALIKTGLKNFLIDLGHIGYFYGLLDECGIKKDDAKTLIELINNKDSISIEMFLDNFKIESGIKDVIQTLPTLFGGREVLEKAEKLCKNEMSLNAVNDLYKIIDALTIYGYEKYVSVDLGLLKGGYYSGVIFRGIARDLGLSILDGGRYDSLCEKFNMPMQAVGFAIGTKRLLKALDNQKSLSKLKPCDVAYISLSGVSNKEIETVSALKKNKMRVMKLFTSDKTELKNYCIKNNIKTAYVFNGEAAEIIEVRT